MRETSHAENPRMRRATSYPVDLSRMSAMEVAVATAPPEERDDFEAIAGVVGLLALKNKSPTPEEDYPAPMLPDDDEMESEEKEAPPPRPAPPPEGFFWQASPKQDGSMAGSSYVDGTFTLYLSALLEQNPSLATQPTIPTRVPRRSSRWRPGTGRRSATRRPPNSRRPCGPWPLRSPPSPRTAGAPRSASTRTPSAHRASRPQARRPLRLRRAPATPAQAWGLATEAGSQRSALQPIDLHCLCHSAASAGLLPISCATR